jgi:transcriptional regulator with XRE-family HTH domain
MTTATQIMLRTMTNIQSLAETYKTKPELFAAVARQSGVSESMVTKMYYGQRTPTIGILDKLAAGVDQLVERRL